LAEDQRPLLLQELEHGAKENSIDDNIVREGNETSIITESHDICSEPSELVQLLQSKLNSYCQELFLENSTKATISLHDSNLHVRIIGRKFNEKNYLNVLWKSQWNANLQEMVVEFEGKANVHVHSYEEGNIQLQANRQFPKVKLHGSHHSEAEKMADKIYWKIRDSEDALQVALNESYARLTDQALKRLRRQLPVTRTKMDWNKFSGYKMSAELGKNDSC